jgi:hypothetical protein
MELSNVLNKRSFLKLVHLVVWLNVLYTEYMNCEFFYGRSVNWIHIKYGYTRPYVLRWDTILEQHTVIFFLINFTCIFLAIRYFFSFRNKFLRVILVLYIVDALIINGILLFLAWIFSKPLLFR